MNIKTVKILLWITLILQFLGLHSWFWEKIGNPKLEPFQIAVLQGLTLLGLLICYK